MTREGGSTYVAESSKIIELSGKSAQWQTCYTFTFFDEFITLNSEVGVGTTEEEDHSRSERDVWQSIYGGGNGYKLKAKTGSSPGSELPADSPINAPSPPAIPWLHISFSNQM